MNFKLYRVAIATVSISALFLGAFPAHAMVTPVFGGQNVSPANRFISYDPYGAASGGNTYDGIQAMPIAGTAQNLYMTAATGGPGTGNGIQWTLYKNQVATALTATMSGTATSASDLTDNVSVSAGDCLNWKGIKIGTNVATSSYSSTFTGSNPDESFIMGLGAGSSTATVYYPIQGGGTLATSSESGTEESMPSAGTIDHLYLCLGQGIGVGNTMAVTLYKNGVATALSATVSNSTITNDLTHSVSVSAGDTLSMEVSTIGGAPTAVSVGWGARFKPTTDGESVLFSYGQFNQSGTRVGLLDGGSFSTGNSDGRYYGLYAALVPANFTLKNLYIRTNSGPGTGTSWTIHDYLYGVGAGNLSALLSGTSNTANDTTHSTSYNLGDYILATRISSGSVNLNMSGAYSFTMFIPPTGGTPPPTGLVPSQFRILGGLLRIIGGHLLIK